MLTASDGPFTTGVLEFSDAYPDLEEPLSRIYVPFKPEGMEILQLALFDPGAHFCILSPEISESIADYLTEGFGQTSLISARGRIQGVLYRHRVELIAKEGEDLEIEATVLVSQDWPGPSILGYTGMLDRMRFAVDPLKNLFYFGP